MGPLRGAIASARIFPATTEELKVGCDRENQTIKGRNLLLQKEKCQKMWTPVK